MDGVKAGAIKGDDVDAESREESKFGGRGD
jgi:hypothetical protein